MAKKERQAKLQEQYGFICCCSACKSENDADFDRLTSVKYSRLFSNQKDIFINLIQYR